MAEESRISGSLASRSRNYGKGYGAYGAEWEGEAACRRSGVTRAGRLNGRVGCVRFAPAPVISVSRSVRAVERLTAVVPVSDGGSIAAGANIRKRLEADFLVAAAVTVRVDPHGGGIAKVEPP